MTARSGDTTAPIDMALAAQDLTSGIGATRDSLTIGSWTAISRITGVVRVVLIGAVLGPTVLSNTYQLTNSLPNLIYYGFLAGSLFSSVLVPTLVLHMDRGDRLSIERVGGGFLGVAMVVLTLVAPVAVVALPEALRVVSLAGDGTSNGDQVTLARWLVLMVMPQVLGYAIIGTSTAAMNARRRFALAAAAPSLENVSIIAVLLLVALLYSRHDSGTHVPTGELLLLGLGSTVAVGVHASLQWWGARRCGVTLRPMPGWRNSEVRRVVRRALPSLAQSGLVALQILTLLLIASRVPGGTIAMQIALNFYALPIAVAATPVALSLLPRLSRLHQSHRYSEFTDTYVRGLGLVLFTTMPSVCGYLILSRPIAHAVAVGRMGTPNGITMVAGAVAAVAAGIVGQALFFVATQAAYATGNYRTPLLAMAVQATVCLGCCAFALGASGAGILIVAGLSHSVANLLGGSLLVLMLRRRLAPGTERLRPSLLRVALGSAIMTLPTASAAWLVVHFVPGRMGWTLGLCVAGAVGLAVFCGTQALLRSPELSWVMHGMRGRTGENIPLNADPV